eukprot:Nitzschia sp. Nitz4//scaffold3_size479765//367779//368231//NITZ4_000153-RA/size479765-processed-gene-1.482-mRNA-1//1//CDS//3329550917//6339//frame0
MRFTFTAVAISTVALAAATATAFTVIPPATALARGSMSDSRTAAVDTTLQLSKDDFIKAEIASNDVVVFSKTYCPYCKATKELFNGLGVSAQIHELDTMGDDGPELQMALFKYTGQKSVPNVFVKGQHIGGNDDTQAAAAKGDLQKLLGL